MTSPADTGSFGRPHHLRMIIQRPDATVYEAARAMESNHVGMVIVQEAGQVVGVVTDRDLTLRVIAGALDPVETPLSDVMTAHPATLPVDAEETEILQLMRDRHVRRIPLVDGGRAVDVSTVDDLIVEGHAPLRAVGDVVRAQLAEPASLKPAGELRPTRPTRFRATRSMLRPDAGFARHLARVTQTLQRLQDRASQATGLGNENVLLAVQIVLGGILQRITPTQAMHLMAQLPTALRERFADLRAGPDRSVTRDTIVAELSRRLVLEPTRASELVRRIGGLMRELVGPRQMEKVQAALPMALRDLLAQ